MDISMYYFTNAEFAQRLAALAKDQGVKIRVIIDRKKDEGPEVSQNNRLTGEVTSHFKGIPSIEVKFHESSINKKMHNKYCLIDGETVITGSLNWTFYACNNHHENVVVIQRSKKVITEYMQRFELLWEDPNRKFRFDKVAPNLIEGNTSTEIRPVQQANPANKQEMKQKSTSKSMLSGSIRKNSLPQPLDSRDNSDESQPLKEAYHSTPQKDFLGKRTRDELLQEPPIHRKSTSRPLRSPNISPSGDVEIANGTVEQESTLITERESLIMKKTQEMIEQFFTRLPELIASQVQSILDKSTPKSRVVEHKSTDTYDLEAGTMSTPSKKDSSLMDFLSPLFCRRKG